MLLEKGAPKDLTDRLDKEIKVYEFLNSLNIEFDRVDHLPAMTMEICEEIDKILKAEICKNLFLCNRQKTEFYLLLTPGKKRFKTKYLSEQIGSSRLSFADEEFMLKYLNTGIGSASVLGLMYDKENKVTLLIDEDVLKSQYIGCHPLINTSSLKIKTSDVLEKILPALNREYKMVVLPNEE